MATINGTTGNDVLVGTDGGEITRVSTDASGGQSNGLSATPIYSPDGSKVAFYSGASNLVSGDVNGMFDVFIKDLSSGAVTLVSTSTAGVLGNGDSGGPLSFSGDGTKLAFFARATNLVVGDTNGTEDIFVKDLVTGVTTRASTNALGIQGNGQSVNPVLSPDGTKIAFESSASNLVAGDTNGVRDIFIKDLVTGAVTLVSTDSAGHQGNNFSEFAGFSPDGTKLAFQSFASNLVAGDTNGKEDIFIRDLATGAVTRVSTDSAGGQANDQSLQLAFSPDGLRVAFTSYASNLVAGDTNAGTDIFVKDLATGAVTRVSTNASGAQGGWPNGFPSSDFATFTPDGTHLTFRSQDLNLIPGGTDGTGQVYLKDLVTGAIELVTVNAAGTQANGFNVASGFTPNGSQVLLTSFASNLTPGDTNGTVDIFVKNLNGDDILTGRGGDDAINGGAGADTAVYSGDRTDYAVTTDPSGVITVQDLRAGSPDGTDTLTSVENLRFADITLNLASGALTGGPGDDTFNEQLGDGTPSIDGGGGFDTLNADWSAATQAVVLSDTAGTGGINDGAGGDSLSFASIEVLNVVAGSGNDTLSGGGGGDRLDGGAGDNTLRGGGGDDSLISHGGVDAVDGGSGVNRWTGDYSASTAALVLDQVAPTAFSLSNGATLQNINVVLLTTGAGDDSFNLKGFGGYFDGGGGTNTMTLDLTGLAGGETLTLFGSGRHSVYLIDGSTGAPMELPNVQVLNLATGAGDDSFTYGRDSDVQLFNYDGGGGQNHLAANFEPLGGGPISFTLDMTPGSTSTFVGQGSTVTNVQSVDIVGSDVDDSLTGGSGADSLNGAYGNDSLNGGGGSDTLVGGQGDDTLDGGNGADTAVFFGSLASYLITTSGGVTIVQDLRSGSPDGTDTLTNVEHLAFADQTITDPSVNRPPIAVADSLSTAYVTPVTVSSTSLVANDTDPNGDSLTLTTVSGAQHGTVSLGGGNVTFTPFVGYVGAAGFSYTVDDGHGGTANRSVTVNVTGTSPGYIYRAGVTAAETIDTTGDGSNHNIVLGSGDDTVFTGPGGSSVKLGAGADSVVGGAGKDTITFGPGLGTVTGGSGPDVFVFMKGQIADPTAHGGAYDTVTDFSGAGSTYAPGRDFIYLKGFATTATITYEHDLSGDPTAHLYRVDDGAYHGEFVLDYAGPGVALSHSQFGFL